MSIGGYIAFAQPHAQQSRVTLPGHLMPALHGLRPIQIVPATTVLPLSIGLRIPNKAGLQSLIQAQSDIRSPLFHHYLTPAQFATKFSPTTAQVNAVIQFLRSNGITVTSTSSNRLLIAAKGTVAHIEHAFQVNLAYFSFSDRKVYAPTNDPSVPATLATIILNVSGLNDVSHAHPLLAPELEHTPHTSHVLPTASHKGPHDPTSCTGLPFNGFTPIQLEKAYDISPLINSGYTGNGERIALVELSGFLASDIANFQTCLGPTGNPINNWNIVSVDGQQNTTDTNTLEVELDMDILQGGCARST